MAELLGARFWFLGVIEADCFLAREPGLFTFRPVNVHGLLCPMHNRHGGAVSIWQADLRARQESHALCLLLMYRRGPEVYGRRSGLSVLCGVSNSIVRMRFWGQVVGELEEGGFTVIALLALMH